MSFFSLLAGASDPASVAHLSGHAAASRTASDDIAELAGPATEGATGSASATRPATEGATGSASATRQFSYDATEAKGRRKTAAISVLSEDWILQTAQRAKLMANSRDLFRNFSIARWVVQRHLDYVTHFDFHCRTEEAAINDEVEALIAAQSLPDANDICGRFSQAEMIRLLEARAVLDGDCGLIKLASGQLQAIESDRVRNPLGMALESFPFNPLEWVQGVRVDLAGRALGYAVHRRDRLRLIFDREVAAANFELHGYFDRFDQVRGVSPLASALNTLRDVYEGFDYALAKAKVSQLFGIKFTTKSEIGTGEITQTDETEADGVTKKQKYDVDFGRGPVKLELDPGDDADFLAVDTPGPSFQEFETMMLMVALKALDIPFSFFDESHTNFFGSRGAWLHYERSCKFKRNRLAALLDRLTRWRLAIAIQDRRLTLPRNVSLTDLTWEWVPVGMPWWNPTQEVNAAVQSIAAGLDTPQRICRATGTGDFYDNLRQIAKAKQEADSLGLALSFAPVPTIDLASVVPHDEKPKQPRK